METMVDEYLRELNLEERQKYGVSSGLKLIATPPQENLRWNANICPGFIILTVNGKVVPSLQNFISMLKTNQSLHLRGMYQDGIHEAYAID
ncbi:MAG: hypothetical protein ACLFUB_06725 [Cyclobacteriaceae bacterium]